MKELILKIVTKKSIDFPLSIEEMRMFPTRWCKQIMYEEALITIEYKPCTGFDLEGFKKLVKRRFKATLQAHSVEFVEREHKEISK